MKTFIKILFSLLLPMAGVAQDLSNFEPMAHYPLKNTAADLLGMMPDIELINAPFTGNDGVYSNGQYIGTSADSPCLIRTPHLDALYDATFAIQLEFRIDTLDGNRPVLVCGDGWRYLGLDIRFDNKWMLRFDGLNYIVPDLVPEAKRWYALTLVFSGLDSTAHYFLDGAKIGERTGKLTRPMDDGQISNTNFGSGQTFKGHWRELKIWKSNQPFTAAGLPGFNASVKVFPNPVKSGEVHISVAQPVSQEPLLVHVYSTTGGLVFTKVLPATGGKLALPASIHAGTYLLVVRAASSGAVVSHKLVFWQ